MAIMQYKENIMLPLFKDALFYPTSVRQVRVSCYQRLASRLIIHNFKRWLFFCAYLKYPTLSQLDSSIRLTAINNSFLFVVESITTVSMLKVWMKRVNFTRWLKLVILIFDIPYTFYLIFILNFNPKSVPLWLKSE